ncbi:MAG TPA: BamA/TamA family outer membrane protein [Amoebophilaceae bacterium]|nr:BamA/TamA family outer membrane protein [Amoebophilaceae bacterium]
MHLYKKKAVLFQLFLLILLGPSICFAQVEQALPVQERIIGVPPFHKKMLYKYSVYQPSRTILGMPIKRWLYGWGKSGYNPQKIERSIERTEQLYARKLAHATSESQKIKLLSRRKKRIEAQKKLLLHGNKLMRMGEKPAAYHPHSVTRNEKIFLHYLRSKGFLDATIATETALQPKRVRILYRITPGRTYTIASSKWVVDDEAIKKVLMPHAKETFVKLGNKYDYHDFVNEQERIVTLLSQHGYFEFDEQYVRFTAEVDADQATLAVATHIDPPATNKQHQTTKIAKVVVYLNTSQQTPTCKVYTETYDGISFVAQKSNYPLKPLAHKIVVRPGDLYDTNKIIETYERLYGIELFDSVAILPKLESDELVIHIHAKLYERMRLQMELGGECVDLNLKKLRPTIKVMPTLRRLFGGLSIAHIEGTAALREQQMFKGTHALYENRAYGLRFKCTKPSFMFFLPGHVHRSLEAFHPRTSIGIGYDFVRNPLYSKKKINLGVHFNWNSPSKHILYEMVPVKIAFMNPHLIDTTEQNNLELRLQAPSFLTTLCFSNTIKKRGGDAYTNSLDAYKWIFHFGLEQGGLYEQFFSIKKMLPKDFLFYKHTKLDGTYRHRFHLAQDTLFVYQVKMGVTIPYGVNAQVHPEKQYEVGGHGGVRAWEMAMLGPGSYEATDQVVERPKGNLLLLGNMEIRQKWITPLEGVLFLDLGNTWQLSKHAPIAMRFDRKKFYKAFAVGGGFGLRLNFYDTFVLCGDLAFKLHKPAGCVVAKSERVVFNVSIGYPF